jgi:hypothetical protein
MSKVETPTKIAILVRQQQTLQGLLQAVTQEAL